MSDIKFKLRKEAGVDPNDELRVLVAVNLLPGAEPNTPVSDLPGAHRKTIGAIDPNDKTFTISTMATKTIGTSTFKGPVYTTKPIKVSDYDADPDPILRVVIKDYDSANHRTIIQTGYPMG